MTSALADLKPHYTGKVREIYELDGDLLMVASDRISAYDVIMPNADPRQGAGAHPDVGLLVRADRGHLPQPPHLRGRAAGGRGPRHAGPEARDVPGRVRRPRLPLGLGLAGVPGAGAVCGIELPAGMRESEKLPEPIFTPATKAELGEHDENIDFDRAAEIIGDRPLMEELRRISIEVYEQAADHAAERGIILADTKFEFGSLAGRRDRPRRRGPDP